MLYLFTTETDWNKVTCIDRYNHSYTDFMILLTIHLLKLQASWLLESDTPLVGFFPFLLPQRYWAIQTPGGT